jgi:hypothetical protein
MLSKIMEAKGPRIADQEAQYAVTCGKTPYLTLQFAVDPHTDKGAEGLIFANNAEGPVPGMEKAAGRLDNPLQHCIQAEVFSHSHDCFEQPCHPFLGLEKLARPGNKVLQEVFDPQAARNVWMGGIVIRRHLQPRFLATELSPPLVPQYSSGSS